MLNKLGQTLLLAGSLGACAKPSPEMEAAKDDLMAHREKTMAMCSKMTKIERENVENKSIEIAVEGRKGIIEGEMGCEDISHWVCSPYSDNVSHPKFNTFMICEGKTWHLGLDGEFVRQR